MNTIKLTLPANIERTPDIDAWLKGAETKINQEARARWANLCIWETTQPEGERMTATEVLERYRAGMFGDGTR